MYGRREANILKRNVNIQLSKEGFMKRGSRGFTIIELIAVIVLVAILTTAVLLMMDDMQSKTRMSNATARALSDVRYAQEMAMSTRREVDVIVNAASNYYEVKWHDTSTYLFSPLTGDDFIVYFDDGEYQDIDIVSTGCTTRLSFTNTGAPLVNGATFGSATSVMLLNSSYYVSVYPSGYVGIETVLGSG